MWEIFKSLETLFLEFNFRRLFFWIFVVIFVVVLFIVWETQTGYFFFGRIEKKALLLKELHFLFKEGVTQDGSGLNPTYQEILAELTKYKTEPFSLAKVFVREQSWKFLSAASLYIVIMVWGFFQKKNDEKWKSTVLGAFFFGLVAGSLGILIPTIHSLWVNCLLYPIFQIVVWSMISKYTKNEK